MDLSTKTHFDCSSLDLIDGVANVVLFWALATLIFIMFRAMVTIGTGAIGLIGADRETFVESMLVRISRVGSRGDRVMGRGVLLHVVLWRCFSGLT